MTMLTGFPRTRWPRRRFSESYAVRIPVKLFANLWFSCYNGNNDRAARVLFVQHPQEQGEWLRQNPRYARVLIASFALLPWQSWFKSDTSCCFFTFLPSAARVRSNCAWNQGVDCRVRNGSYRGTMVKNHVLSVNIFISYEEISYSCENHRIQKYL